MMENPQITYEEFLSDVDLQDVNAFRILQIGETANDLSEHFKNTFAEMPWHKISGFRNIIAHEYGNIEPETLWNTIKLDIPKLRDYCTKIIQKN